jgi:CSLREA domain-containing protein
LVAIVAIAALAPASASALTLTVDTATDSNDGVCGPPPGEDCSLREAITENNNNNNDPVVDTIAFDIPGTAPYTIQPSLPLDLITDPVTIDGFTEPQSSGAHVIELDGQLLTVPFAAAPGLRLHEEGADSTIRGLVINRFPNAGILVEDSDNNTIEQNLIGTDVGGTLDRGNGRGIDLTNGSANTMVGGNLPGEGNVISGNALWAVISQGTGDVTANTIWNNHIGTDKFGIGAIGNDGYGVFLAGEADFVGDLEAGPPDTWNNIANTTNGPGIAIDSGFDSIIGRNHVYGNAGLGIDMRPLVGPDPNDVDDEDEGQPHDFQNFPVIDTAVAGGTTQITGTLDTPPDMDGSTYGMIFYKNSACDPGSPGHGEGEVFLGRIEATADDSRVDFSGAVGNTSTVAGDQITGMVSVGPSGSSEFSACVEAEEPPQANQDVVAGEVSGTIRYRLPGSDQFVELQDQEALPEGTTFDTTEGEVRIVSQAPNPTPPDDNSGLREATFSEGLFKLLQDDKAPFTTEARLAGGSKCSSGKTKRAGGRKRRLRSRGRGRHRSRGRRGAGTVRGTDWLTKDRCNGTLFEVFEGQVQVKDFGRKRKVTLDAGESYLARNRR